MLYFENQNQTVQNTPTYITEATDDYENGVEDMDLEKKNLKVSVSLINNERDLVKALEKHKGRRNKTADEWGFLVVHWTEN